MKTTLAVTIITRDRATGETIKTTLDVAVGYNPERNIWQHELPNGVLTYGESAHGLAARIGSDAVSMLHS